MKKKRHSYEEAYFHGRYQGVIGNFSNKELQHARYWFSAWLKKLDRYVPVEKGDGRKVLEIGTAIGGTASLLADRGFSVIASDISSYAVKKAQQLSPHIKFVVLDVQKKITLKGEFDLIIAFEVVEHLEQPERAIKHMYDKLSQGGYLVLSTPYPYSWSWNDPTHINVLYPEEWITMLKKTGFTKVAFHKFSLLPFFYKIHPRFQLIMPFHIPLYFINNPVYFIGRKER